MEITRPQKSAYELPNEPVGSARSEPASMRVEVAEQAVVAGQRPLEQLHDALRSLPEVDMDKVRALRKALSEGTLDTSSASLAVGILAYHGETRG